MEPRRLTTVAVGGGRRFGLAVLTAAIFACGPATPVQGPPSEYAGPPYWTPPPGTFIHGKAAPPEVWQNAPPPRAQDAAGPMIDIAIVDATIGPGKSDHTQWDGPAALPPSVARDLWVALDKKDAYAAVMALYATPAVGKLDKPEPVGWAELIGSAKGVQRVTLQPIPGTRSTLTPVWTDAARWSHVPLSDKLRIRIDVLDQDDLVDDLIGVCEISYQNLVDARASGDVFRVAVGDQTRRQILFLGITVRTVK